MFIKINKYKYTYETLWELQYPIVLDIIITDIIINV